MNLHFKHITAGYNDWTQISPRFGAVSGPGLRNAAFDAVCLARSGREFFAGSFPSIVYFPDDCEMLPWQDEYHVIEGTSCKYRRDRIAQDVTRIATELVPVNPFENMRKTYWSRSLCGSDKTILQGLAVETMLLADGCINLLLEAKAVAALPWLCAAYKGIIDCVRQAQLIVDVNRVARQEVGTSEGLKLKDQPPGHMSLGVHMFAAPANDENYVF